MNVSLRPLYLTFDRLLGRLLLPGHPGHGRRGIPRRSFVKTRAAVLCSPNTPVRVEEIKLDEPLAGEAMVRVVASGVCHSDQHFISGDMPVGRATTRWCSVTKPPEWSSASGRGKMTLLPATVSSSPTSRRAGDVVGAAPVASTCVTREAVR
jgi:hypothetical protein